MLTQGTLVSTARREQRERSYYQVCGDAESAMGKGKGCRVDAVELTRQSCDCSRGGYGGEGEGRVVFINCVGVKAPD